MPHLKILVRASARLKVLTQVGNSLAGRHFLDSGLVKGDAGIIFENLVAICLVKHNFDKSSNLKLSLNSLLTFCSRAFTISVNYK